MNDLIKIIISSFLILFAHIFKIDFLYFIAYIISGYEVIFKAFRNILKGEVFDENFLMVIATIGAFCIKEYPEATFVMLLYKIGELFEDYATDKSRKAISSVMNIRPDYANVYRENKVLKVDPNEVLLNEVIVVKPGEKIPLDGIVLEGSSYLNTLALTGESVPRKVEKNDEVLSGCINNSSVLKIKVSKKFSESTASKILDLVENASNRKSKSENFISKFSKYYTPIVVFLALLLILIPTLIFNQPFNVWIYRALSFLVVSCPCALVISVPLSFFGGLGAASKIGVLIKGSNYLETLSKVDTVVCDKTGTLTEGVFEVQEINDILSNNILKYAAYAEYYSNHPISLSLKKAYKEKINEKLISNFKETSGKGVEAVIDGKKILVGNEKFMKENNIEYKQNEKIGTNLYIAIDGKYAGNILISDKIKKDSYKAVESLKENNIKIVMLTGDHENISKDVASKLKLDEYHSNLLPADKVSYAEKLMKSINGELLFVGDGINDAPVLALSDIGVAMGGLGSDAAVEASDIVIMTDEISKIASSIKISKKTMQIVKENILFAITIKICILILSALGIASMWSAVFADVGVTILAILNALRILRYKA